MFINYFILKCFTQNCPYCGGVDTPRTVVVVCVGWGGGGIVTTRILQHLIYMQYVRNSILAGSCNKDPPSLPLFPFITYSHCYIFPEAHKSIFTYYTKILDFVNGTITMSCKRLPDSVVMQLNVIHNSPGDPATANTNSVHGCDACATGEVTQRDR